MNTITTTRRLILAAAAFGLVSIGLVQGASADTYTARATARASIDAGIKIKVSSGNRVTRRDPRNDWRPDHRPVDQHRRAMRRFDYNRNGILDATERKPYWTYLAGTGVYGQLSSDEQGRFGQLAPLFDANRDGRLVGIEWRGMDKLIDSLRLFKTLDRNGDRYLSAYEVGFSALAPRFRVMDRNHDRYVSQQEVRDEMLRQVRTGEC
ncbi:MAG TPA: hypothetical protein VNO33_02820 [Kofleriaceae bacterium]|nr:hypothetical protein [Kofleriaceae bacterium]